MSRCLSGLVPHCCSFMGRTMGGPFCAPTYRRHMKRAGRETDSGNGSSEACVDGARKPGFQPPRIERPKPAWNASNVLKGGHPGVSRPGAPGWAQQRRFCRNYVYLSSSLAAIVLCGMSIKLPTLGSRRESRPRFFALSSQQPPFNSLTSSTHRFFAGVEGKPICLRKLL